MYGGDEFVVLLPELEGRESALAAARKIRARLAVPYIVDGVKITVTASIGVAVYPVDGLEYGDLMRVTDGFMYRDKARNAALSRDGTAACFGRMTRAPCGTAASGPFLTHTIRSGRTQSSNWSAVTAPSARAASRSDVPSAWAFFAMAAARS